MLNRMIAATGFLLLSICAASAQTPSPEAMAAARNLVTTLKLTDQYQALLPAILFSMKPTLVQDRPEIERDFDAMIPVVLNAYKPFYDNMLDGAAAIYAKNFSVDELKEIESFYRRPTGQKFLEKSHDLAQLSSTVGEEISRKAADDIRARMIQLLRDKGHKF